MQARASVGSNFIKWLNSPSNYSFLHITLLVLSWVVFWKAKPKLHFTDLKSKTTIHLLTSKVTKWKWMSLSLAWLCEFSRSEYWSGKPFSSSGDLQTQGLNPGSPHCRRILYQLSHKGSPRILEWVAYLFFSGSSWPRDRTWVSCIAGRFFTNWTMKELQKSQNCYEKTERRSHIHETVLCLGHGLEESM